MIVARAWSGKRFAVLGLARSGAATVRALAAAGASVTAWDHDAVKCGALQDELGHGAFAVENLEAIDLAGFDALVLSPGVPLNTHPLAAKARSAGVRIIGDIELFAEARADLPPHKVIGITGTNGKSTTTALVHHILKTAGVPTLMGGNIGLPILDQAPLPEGGVYVLELSSYQLDLTESLDCDVAVLLNVTPDHLDRYDGMEAYAASKARLFAMQSSGRTAVFSGVDEFTSGLCNVLNRERNGNVLWVDNTFDEILGISVFEGKASIYGEPIARQDKWPALQGPHNAENAGAAIGVCHLLGINNVTTASALSTFNGLPHRMDRVATLDGVTYVDDSKATNPESAAPALAAFPRVHWILGGLAKSDDLDACAPHFGHVVRAYTIGDAGPRFARVLEGRVAVEQCGTLDRAVAAAARRAERGETVLLSPACASFDQFRDYEERGAAFRRAVEALDMGVGA